MSSRFITPLPSPPSIKSPPRSSATLAMSIQVHPAIIHSPSTMYQPSPSYPDASNNLRRSLYSLTRPPSPMTNIRPLSRSEKILRETLRRAEEHDRVNGSPFFLPTPLKEDDDSDCDCEDVDGLYNHRVGSSPRSRSTRNSSIDQKRSVSPTPQRGYPRRASTASSSNEDVLTPHDAVLKRRLEGVLSQARDQDRGQSRRSTSRSRAYTRESNEDWNVRSLFLWFFSLHPLIPHTSVSTFQPFTRLLSRTVTAVAGTPDSSTYTPTRRIYALSHNVKHWTTAATDAIVTILRRSHRFRHVPSNRWVCEFCQCRGTWVTPRR